MAIQIVIGNNGFIKTQDIRQQDCVREKTGGNNMEKEIVVKPCGIFCRPKKKEGKAEKLKRYMHVLHDAWVGD